MRSPWAAYNNATPIILHGSLQGSVEALRRMAELEPAVIVPGHGHVCRSEVIDDWFRYFDFLGGLAARRMEAGLTPLDNARSEDLGQFAKWQHPERIVLNLHRAVAELEGASPGGDLDHRRVFDEMLELNPSSYGHKIIRGREEYVSQASG